MPAGPPPAQALRRVEEESQLVHSQHSGMTWGRVRRPRASFVQGFEAWERPDETGTVEPVRRLLWWFRHLAGTGAVGVEEEGIQELCGTCDRQDLVREGGVGGARWCPEVWPWQLVGMGRRGAGARRRRRSSLLFGPVGVRLSDEQVEASNR